MRVLTGLALWIIGQQSARGDRRLERRRARRKKSMAKVIRTTHRTSPS